MRKVRLVNGEYYHVYNRSTDKRTIFLDAVDFAENSLLGTLERPSILSETSLLEDK